MLALEGKEYFENSSSAKRGLINNVHSFSSFNISVMLAS